MNKIDGLLPEVVLALTVPALLVPTFDAGTVAARERCATARSNALAQGGDIFDAGGHTTPHHAELAPDGRRPVNTQPDGTIRRMHALIV